jgi:hypothetical protein
MSDSSETLSFVGEVAVSRATLFTHDGKSIDILPMIGDLSLYEDIFSTTMSGHILIEDSLDLINNAPLIGQEMFSLHIKTPTLSTSIEKIFYIYKLQARKSKKRVQTYMLNFCSRELIYSANSKVAQSFSGNITDTVESIFRDKRYIASESKIFLDKTKNSYSFIAPYWTPLETINWLTGKSINENGVPNYLFFETNQSFEYSSVDKLISATPRREYIFTDVDALTVTGANGDKDKRYSIVESMETGVTFDYLRNLNSGMFASRLSTIDLTTKNINTNTFDYIDDFNKSNHLEKYPLKTNSALRRKLSSIYFMTKNNYQTGSFKQQGYKDFFLQRNSLLEQLSAFKITIKVPGRTDMKAGSVVKFTMPELRQILADEIDTSGISDYFSGNYLVTAIKHQIISGRHTMLMEIVSDSFIKPLLKTV